MEQFTVNLILGAGLTVCGWLAREMWTAVKELKADIAKLREELPTQYVRKDDLEKAIDRIEAALERIFDRLDSKVDK